MPTVLTNIPLAETYPFAILIPVAVNVNICAGLMSQCTSPCEHGYGLAENAGMTQPDVKPNITL